MPLQTVVQVEQYEGCELSFITLGSSLDNSSIEARHPGTGRKFRIPLKNLLDALDMDTEATFLMDLHWLIKAHHVTVTVDRYTDGQRTFNKVEAYEL